jgi:tight adherence protein C
VLRYEVVAAALAGFAGLTATVAIAADRPLAPGLARIKQGEDAVLSATPPPAVRWGWAEARERALRLLEAMGRGVRAPEGLARQLKWAGIGIPPAAWQALPYFLGLAGLALGVAASAAAGHVLVLAVLGGFAGAVGPSVYLSRRLAARRGRIAREILSYSEYLAMAMRAGADFRVAVRQVQERFPGPVADAFAGALLTMNAGGRVDEGLRLAQEEMCNPDVDAIIDVLRQNLMLGAQCADFILNTVQSLRRQRAEQVMETAGKATLLLLVPLAVFDLPAVFFVAVFPMLSQALGFLHAGGGTALP